MSIFRRNILNFIIYILAFLKNAIYGLSIFFTSSLTASTDVLDILALRFLMSFVVFWLLKVCGIFKIKLGVKDFFVKNERTPYIKNLLLTAIFEPVLYMIFETCGISMTTGITAAVILSLAPITSCIFEIIFLKENASFAKKIFLLLGIVGVVFIAVNTKSSEGKDTLLGILMITCAVITGSLYSVFSRKSSKAFSGMEISYFTALLGALIFNSVNIVRHLIRGDILHYFDPYFNWENLIGFVFLAVVSTIVATSMNNYALSKMQVSTMAAFSGVSTFTTIIVGVIFFNEKLYYFHIIGLTLIVIRMVGVTCISIKKQAKIKAEKATDIQALTNTNKT